MTHFADHSLNCLFEQQVDLTNPAYTEGWQSIQALLQGTSSQIMAFDMAEHLSDALGDLIDLPLNMNNADASMDRLRGAAYAIAVFLQRSIHAAR